MSSSSEDLGFSLNVDVADASVNLTRFERSIEGVEKAMERASHTGLTVDSGDFEKSIRAMEGSLDQLGIAMARMASRMEQAVSLMAASVATGSGAMAAQVTQDLARVDRELDKHRAKVQQVSREQNQASSGSATSSQPRSANGRYASHGSGGGGSAGSAGGGGMAAMEGELLAEGGAVAGTAVGATAGAGLMNPVTSFLGGLAGAAVGKQIMGYALSAVAESSEEYIRESNLGTRLAPGRNTDKFSAETHAVGADEFFTRGETMDAAESMSSFGKGGGLQASDVKAALHVARGYGMQAGDVGQQFNSFATSGAVSGGINQGAMLAGELASAIEKGDMRSRAAEAMEAAAATLEDAASQVGNLSNGQREGVLAFQGMLNGSGQEMFRGQNGAGIMQGISAAIRPDSGDDTHETIMNQALVKYGGMAGKSPVDLLMKREGPMSENIGAVTAFLKDLSGGDNQLLDVLAKQHLNLPSLHAAKNLREVTKGYTDFGSIDAKAGLDELDRAGDQQRGAFKGRPDTARRVDYEGEQFRRKAGSAAFDGVKGIQEGLLALGNVAMDFAAPAIDTLNAGLRQLTKNIREGLGGGAGGSAPAPGPGGYAPTGPTGAGLAMQPGITTKGMHPAMVSHATDFEAAFGGQLSSGYRSPGKNKATTGVPNSYHMSGQAFDIKGPGKERSKEIQAWAAARGLEAIWDKDHDGLGGYHWHMEPAPGRGEQALNDPHGGSHPGATTKPKPGASGGPVVPRPAGIPQPGKPAGAHKPSKDVLHGKLIDPLDYYSKLSIDDQLRVGKMDRDPFYGGRDPKHKAGSTAERQWMSDFKARNGRDFDPTKGEHGKGIWKPGDQIGRTGGTQIAQAIDFKQVFYVNGGNPEDVKRQAQAGAKAAIAAAHARATQFTGA